MKYMCSYVLCNCPSYRRKRIVKPIGSRGITGKSVRFTGGLHQTQLPRSARQVVPALLPWYFIDAAALLFFFGLLLVRTDTACRSCRCSGRAWAFFILLFTQVCQAAPPSARSALHRTEVPGAPVLLQTHRRHTYRHFPHGDAGSAASNHMTQVLLCVNIPQRTLNPNITKRSSYFVPSTMWKANKHTKDLYWYFQRKRHCWSKL